MSTGAIPPTSLRPASVPPPAHATAPATPRRVREPAPGRRRPRRQFPAWLPTAALLLLALVPTVAGALRVVELGSGPEPTPQNARFVASPWPVVLHVLGSVPFLVLGALQLNPRLRRRSPRWHRRAGRLVVVCGLVSASTGLWMTVAYDLSATDGIGLGAQRIGFGALMAFALLAAVRAVRLGNVRSHRAWMLRAYAVGMGAGTQVLTHVPYQLLVGAPGEGGRAVLMGAGWLLNLAVAEWLIRRDT